jgi:hypothetical protein
MDHQLFAAARPLPNPQPSGLRDPMGLEPYPRQRFPEGERIGGGLAQGGQVGDGDDHGLLVRILAD